MPSFILDKPQSTEDTFIFVLVSCWDGRLKISTREKVCANNWNPTIQRPTVNGKGDLRGKALLLKINRLYDALETQEMNCQIAGERFTKAVARSTIESVLQHKPTQKKMRFEEAALQIISEMRLGVLTNQKGSRYSGHTIKHYNHTLNALKGFRDTTGQSIEFMDVTMHTYNKFIEYCNQKKWTLNTTGTHIKNWKQFFERGAERGWHKSKVHLERGFKTLHEDTHDIALSEAELKKMEDKRLIKKEHEYARDWFLIGAYTGLRISDLSRLGPDHLHGDTLVLSNEKTDERVAIPVHPVVKKILRRWKGFPPLMADQTLNEKIKEVAQLSKINGKVLYTVTQGGARVDTVYEKWQMVSFHTARRSFITNARKNGVPDAIVMKLAGIRKPQTLVRYDKLSPEDAATIAAGHAFFKK